LLHFAPLRDPLLGALVQFVIICFSDPLNPAVLPPPVASPPHHHGSFPNVLSLLLCYFLVDFDNLVFTPSSRDGRNARDVLMFRVALPHFTFDGHLFSIFDP